MPGFMYFALYKPYGYLSQFTAEVPGQLTLKDLYDFPREVYPVGRLDKASEGLLLLTNDKELNQLILTPRADKWKKYYVQVEGIPNDAELKPLHAGVDLRIRKKQMRTRPARARIINEPNVEPRIPPIRMRKHIPTAWLEIAITEGKFHQVRKMCAAIGFPVLRLIRVQIGDYQLPDFSIGKVHPITDRRAIIDN